MTIVATVFVIALVLILIIDQRRLTAIDCVERAERLRIRFSAIRHSLVMHAGSGEMRSDEKKVFYFLYGGTTFMLRHPRAYHPISNAFCAVLMDPPPEPPALKREDVSPYAVPLLRQYIAACDDLVQQFADPRIKLLAYLSGESVVDLVKNIGRRHRELQAEERRVRDTT